ncbi:MAG: 2-amino-4-hydroxy-6-hydroxymethyldihydropteridine diphosphokinase [Paracoccaceae bacterium]
MTPRYSYIAIGANMKSRHGNPRATLAAALALFASEKLRISAQSSWYETPAFPAGNGPDYVNAVVAVKSTLAPAAQLAALHRIEAEMGRARLQRWGARVCDLDLLAVDDAILPDIATWRSWFALPLAGQMRDAPTELILPHPRLQDRSFVLVPWAEIAPDWQHPTLHKSVLELRDALPLAEIAEIRAIS